MFYTKVTKLFFNNEAELELQPDDIVVFVGPNNSGKSQSLRDIYGAISDSMPHVVIRDVEISRGNIDELKDAVISSSSQNDSGGNVFYSGYSYNVYNWCFNQYNMGSKLINHLRSFVVSFLKTEDRLALSNPPSAIDKSEPKTHPIQYLLFEKHYQSLVSKYFKEAFGYCLIPDYVSRKKVSLCMGDVPTLQAGNAPEVMEELRSIIESYPKVHEQGDGMRSFSGIVLHLILKNYGIFLIDEPESFLHPPQARIIGRVIGELLGKNRQAFISTHSEDVIQGLLDNSSRRIKVVRITRDGNTNHFSILDNNQFKSIWNDPLLKHSNIMNSLFHKNVVLCEGDSDCRLYSIILDHLKEKEGRYSETLFIHCGGKKRMKQVIKALRSLSIDYRCIPDIDVLDEKRTIKDLFISCGGEWTENMDLLYKRFSSNLNSGTDSVSKTAVRNKVDKFLKSLANESLTSSDVEQLSRALKIETKWSLLKTGGVSVIPSGEARTAFNSLNNEFKKIGIYVVPVGQLERFIPEEGGHGPGWINAVIEKYKDLDSEVYKHVTSFVASWGL